MIILDDIIQDYAKDTEEVNIIAGCDKNFISCCNKFNNVINFRGTPLRPKKDFINLV
ncbi:hypothetical protein A1C_03735 [Rickettsia akari str. Hartford]|uniref:Bacteriophage phiJL001 Gp84 C-terminal domain-containing protein n=1 Tax=Rickettsia akari (strain Hartford) TaxID=293614 RepID=A8GNP9_RICAH|nr:hypothetical protein A1C_03735 [Rickettsia akari str. Hartford]